MRWIWMMGALATLSACGGKDTPSGQVVATVNGEEITRAEVNASLPENTPSNSKAATNIRNTVLEQLVAQRVVAQEAKRNKLDKSQQYLLATRRAEVQILAQLMTSRVLQAIRTPDDAAVDQYIAANPTRFADRVIFSADQIRAPGNAIDPASLKDVHTLDGVLARFEAAGVQVARGSISTNSAGLSPQATRALLTMPAGEPFLTTENGLLLASVITSTRKAPLVGDSARKAALVLMRQEAGATALKRQYEALRKTAKVNYQNGFAPRNAAAPSATR